MKRGLSKQSKLLALGVTLFLSCAWYGTAHAQAGDSRTAPRVAVPVLSADDKLAARLDKLEAEVKLLTSKNAALAVGLNALMSQKPLTEDTVAVFRVVASKTASGSYYRKVRIDNDLANNNPKALVLATSQDTMGTFHTEYADGHWWIVATKAELEYSASYPVRTCDTCAPQAIPLLIGYEHEFKGGEKFTVLVVKQ
jgi:hypothetical protein